MKRCSIVGLMTMRGATQQFVVTLAFLACCAGSEKLQGITCDTSTSTLFSTQPVTWVNWKRASHSLDPAHPANPAYIAVYNAWQQSPPSFKDEVVTLDALQGFMRTLVAEDPFGKGGLAPQTPIDKPGYVALSQRQLAWLLVRCFLGDDISEGTELAKAIKECQSTDQVHAVLSMLAVLSIELRGGCQGAYIVAAKPSGQPTPSTASASLAPLNACLVQDGETLFGSLPCGVGVDFMQNNRADQAIIDIAGANVGGGARLCNLASQDESLMQFFPEVMALSFFSTGMLHPPMTIFGARRYMNNYVGNGVPCGQIQALPTLLNNDISNEVSSALVLEGKTLLVYSQAFVAQQSRLNDVSIDNQIAQWVIALSPDTHPGAMLPLLCDVIHAVGTGPWGAGAWHGSSQWFLFATWLGTTVISEQLQQKCGHPVTLNYYVYNVFCENPAAQCSVCAYCEDPTTPERDRRASVCTPDSCNSCKGGG
eukprot:5141907-Amphidinium_carterae.1